MLDSEAVLARIRTIAPTHAPLEERIGALRNAIEYRLIEDTDALIEVQRLRYAAYAAAGGAGPNREARLGDSFDQSPNCAIYTLLFEGFYCASIRLHLVRSFDDASPACEIFPELLAPLITQGARLIDPNSFCVHPALSGTVPELAYLTLRLPYMLSELGQRSMVTATVRTEHMAFYRRMLRARLIAEPRAYPGRLRPLGLMLVDFEAEREAILGRNAFFAGSAGEARAIGLDRIGSTQKARMLEAA